VRSAASPDRGEADAQYDAPIDGPLPLPDPPLSGAGFVLRPFRPDDLAAARRLLEDEAAARWVPALPADDGSGVASFYEGCREDGTLLHLVIADSGGDYLGELMVAPGEHGVAELGCCLAAEARGNGVAAAAFTALSNWALAREGLGLARLQAFVALENPAGIRLAQRAGYRREGVLRSYWELDGRRLDVALLARVYEA
jgi:ribosomal-protein-alanine N-acetyltransferase